VRTPAPDQAPSTELSRKPHGPAARAREVPPATNSRAAASTDATGTAHRGPSPCKTGADPVPTTAAAPEVSTEPEPDLDMAPAMGPVNSAADKTTDTGRVTDTDPDIAGAVGSTEPAAIGSPATTAGTQEGAGEAGAGPGSGGRYRHGHS
jgi:hypothetical protein